MRSTTSTSTANSSMGSQNSKKQINSSTTAVVGVTAANTNTTNTGSNNTTNNNQSQQNNTNNTTSNTSQSATTSSNAPNVNSPKAGGTLKIPSVNKDSSNTATKNNMPLPHVAPGLLPPLTAANAQKGQKTLVLDLDETLVHSSFKPIPNPDFVISIELEGVVHKVYVRKRPGVDAFLRAVHTAGWEIVIFTASLSKYADPLLDILDKNKVIVARLFREHCVQHHGNYVKDMTQLGRRVEHVVIVDNSPFSYMFQPENAIAIISWFNDKSDRQLYELLPFLDQINASDDVIECMAQKTAWSGQSTHGPTHGTSIPQTPGLTTGLIAQYGNPDGDD